MRILANRYDNDSSFSLPFGVAGLLDSFFSKSQDFFSDAAVRREFYYLITGTSTLTSGFGLCSLDSTLASLIPLVEEVLGMF